MQRSFPGPSLVILPTFMGFDNHPGGAQDITISSLLVRIFSLCFHGVSWAFVDVQHAGLEDGDACAAGVVFQVDKSIVGFEKFLWGIVNGESIVNV